MDTVPENVFTANPTASGRYRNVCFTTFFAAGTDGNDEWERYLNRSFDSGRISYLVGQLERSPDTGRLHIQGYAELKTQCTLNELKSIFNDNGIHIERRRGTQRQAIAYCCKTDSRISGPIELGEAKAQGMSTDDVSYYRADQVRRYPNGSFARKRGYPYWERVERDCDGVFRSVRKVPRWDNDNPWALEGEAMQGLLALNSGTDDIEDLAGGGALEAFIAELEADLMGDGASG